MSDILLNPGPTNTRFVTKIKQWLGSDICHREDTFKTILRSLQEKLLSAVKFSSAGRIAILCGSGTAAMEAMISSLAPNDTLVVNAGKYGQRAMEIFKTYNIQCAQVNSRIVDDLVENRDVKYVYYVENETSTGEHYSLEKMCKIYPEAKFIIDATSAFGASDYKKLGHRIAALSFCSNKCLQSTPGLGIVLWNKEMQIFDRSYYGNLSKYQLGHLPFTLPTQSVYALEYTVDQSLENEKIFNLRREKLISAMSSIGIECINSNPANSIIAFKHPRMGYKKLHDFLLSRKIVIYSGVDGVDRSFRVATMSVDFDIKFKKIVKAFKDTV